MSEGLRACYWEGPSELPERRSSSSAPRRGSAEPRPRCLENPMNSMKRQNDRILKEKLPRLIGAQYATGDQWRNNSRKNEGMEPKQKQHPIVNGTGDRSKIQCCKEQYCIGTWNIRWQPTPVFLPGELPWTEEPGGATVHRVAKSQTQLRLDGITDSMA